MATNVDEEVTHVDTECTALLTDEHTNTSHTGNGQSGVSRRTRLVNLGRLLLHLVCLAYSLYLIWLLAYLKDNKNYWFLNFIPLVCNFLPFLWFCKACHDNDFPKIGEGMFIIYDHSYGVGFNLMACFTMLTRQAYYHRQPDEFIGPGFIILSLKASIILILLDFLLHIVGKRYSFLDYKDARLAYYLISLVEILTMNVCVGVGSYVSQDSSTEKAIQALSTISFRRHISFSEM